jgi:tetratricopeptide (TPR) repeat protein
MINSGNLEEGLEVIERERKFLQYLPDFHFVSGLFYTDLILSDVQRYVHLLPQIEQSYRKALEVGETDKYSSVRGTGSFAAWYNLGVYYEMTGRESDAIHCYSRAAEYEYEKAIKRLKQIKKHISAK